MRTGNPALNDATFQQFQGIGTFDDTMTLDGTVTKCFMLLACVLLTAGITWYLFWEGQNQALVSGLMLVGIIGGLIVALVTVFKQTWAPVTAPVYGLLEGLAIGGISAMFEAQYPGIVIQAVALTFGTCLVLLLAYKSRLIQATENFKLGVVAATGAIALIYFVSFILRMFGVHMPYIHGSGLIGIGFSIAVVTIAALNLVLDFDFIERGVQTGAPRYMEWYGAFGLMVTLIWLYIEILRLLSKLRSR